MPSQSDTDTTNALRALREHEQRYAEAAREFGRDDLAEDHAAHVRIRAAMQSPTGEPT